MEIQTRIRNARVACGMTQAQLARTVGCSEQEIRDIEDGFVPLTRPQIQALADALHVTEASLLGLPEKAQENTPQEVREDVPDEATAENAHTRQTAQPPAEEPAVPKRDSAEAHPNRKKLQPLSVVNLVLCCVLMLAVFVSLANISVLRSEIARLKTSGAGVSVVIQQGETPDYSYTNKEDGSLDAAALIEAVLPSVVYVQAESSSGSGVIISEDGWLITCAHVVQTRGEDGLAKTAQNVTIVTNDGVRHTSTEVYADSSSDIAVIKISGTFTAATIGDSSKVVPGEEVVAVGTPLSESYFQTATKGIVSAVRNQFNFSQLGRTLNVIQHDAAINSGNSGGPLFNRFGQLIGINSIKTSTAGGYENMGFAIVSNDAMRYAADLIAHHKVNRPMIGITGQTVQTPIAGIYVAGLTQGGSAESSGVQVGDIITYADGTRMTSINQMIAYLSSKNAGDSVDLTIIRDGKEIPLKLTLKSSLDLDY